MRLLRLQGVVLQLLMLLWPLTARYRQENITMTIVIIAAIAYLAFHRAQSRQLPARPAL